MLIKNKTLEEAALERAALFDDFDHVYAPGDGHIVVVAVSDGVHVCWQCGEPFDEHDRAHRMVEKLNDRNTTVPCGVHAKCFSGAPKTLFSFMSVTKIAAGIREKRVLARSLAYADRIATAALEGAKKIIT